MAVSSISNSANQSVANSFSRKSKWAGFKTQMSAFGKSLLVPIALLPIAAILLRIGAVIPTGGDNSAFANFVGSILLNAGDVVFGVLPILFAVGVAFGLAKDHRGEAAISAFIGIALLTVFLSGPKTGANLAPWFGGVDLVDQIYHSLNLGSNGTGFHGIFTDPAYTKILSNNVLNGVVIGCIVAWIYNRFNGIELPSALGFFSGRRLIPVLVIMTTVFFAILWAIIFPWFGYVLFQLSDALGQAQGDRYANSGIMFAYGILNRILLPFGMHHVPNTLFWFTLGSHPTPPVTPGGAPGIANGDIFIFLNGIAKGNTAGTFQSGFFPVMMFGLPALAAAMIHNAENRDQKIKALGILGGAAIISFFTGITEPLEFAFLFASPLLFGVHAILTGFWGFITGLFGIQLGFGFSAGLIDYTLSIPKSLEIIAANKTGIDAAMAHPAWLWVIGALAAANYFFVGNYFIKKFNLATPGRNGNLLVSIEDDSVASGQTISPQTAAIVLGFGGWNNIVSYDNCATRLRYDVVDAKKVNQAALKKAGVVGISVISNTHVQAIIGPKAELVNQRIVESKNADLSAFANTEILIENHTSKAKSVEIDVYSVTAGQTVELSTLNDGVFSEKLIGDGVVIKLDPKTEKARIYAPISGELVSAFPTGHAFGIKSKEGVEILIHIGLETVALKGKGFSTSVIQGQQVHVGELLTEVNVKEIKDLVPSVDPIVVITSGQSALNKNLGPVTETSKIFTTK